MNYPEVYKTEMSGNMLKNILEDVCDNIFNIDPFFQQGGDMVRVGGLSYSCNPKGKIGERIKDLHLVRNGKAIENSKNYVVSGWGSVNKNVEGPPIYDLLEKYITEQRLVKPKNPGSVKVLGME